ncbi:MAG: cyclohydrolase [Hyphomicrobiales bacterium]|jgi:GTP cyclohydrolase II|nr:cyclohydrolase [Hyphomicrobiales bacterium]
MKNGNGHAGGGVFGSPDRVMVKRGLAEFRAGRPVIISSASAKFLIALPVDGIDAARLAAFAVLCAPHEPKLVVSARRACALGIDATGPMALPLPDRATPEDIYSLVADADPDPVDARTAAPAGASAAASVELAKFAQRLPALLVAETVSANVLIEPPLVVITAEAIGKFRHDMVHSLEIAGEAKVPLQGGIATRFVVFRDAVGGGSVAVIVGKPDFSKPVPVRLHSACLTGDVFGSRRCDCGDQLGIALERLSEEGGGVILYLEQEGRGLGLANKMRAYALQDEGLDTVDANTMLGFDDDERDYGIAARMLKMLGCTRILLMTNNPLKLAGLTEAGIEVSGRKALQAPVHAHNRRYLTAKAMRAGHKLDHLIGVLSEAGDKHDAVPAE